MNSSNRDAKTRGVFIIVAIAGLFIFGWPVAISLIEVAVPPDNGFGGNTVITMMT